MTSAKPGKPLYELLQEDEAPRPAADAPAGPGSASYLRVPMSTAYISVALVIGLVLLAWVGGHAVGFRAGKAVVVAGLAPDPVQDLLVRDPTRTDPTRTDPPRSGEALPDPLPASTPPTTPVASRQGPTTPSPERAEGAIISASGMLAADPRQPGSTYLALATLPEGPAGDAVQFLASQGVAAVAVPTSGGRYQVVSLAVEIPDGRYRDSADQRRAHEQQVAQIGQRWLREFGGASDFSRTLWAKYTP